MTAQHPGDPYTFAASGSVTAEAEPEPVKVENPTAKGEWLPIDEAANRVGASAAALRQSIKDGTLRAGKVGRQVLVWIEAE